MPSQKRKYSSSASSASAIMKRMKKNEILRKTAGANVQFIAGRVTTGNQGPEIKSFDTVASGTTVSTTGLVVSLLAGMPQGTSSLTRVGNNIKIKSVYVKTQIHQTAGNTGINFGRWSLVLDKQPDGATAVVGSVYANATSNLTQLTVANLERFQVLAAGDLSEPMLQGVKLGQFFEKYVKCDIGTRFTDSTGEAITNGLYFIVTTQASAGNPIMVDYNIRVRYSDE